MMPSPSMATATATRDQLLDPGKLVLPLQNTFGSGAAEVFRKSDGIKNARNARIHVATYQTLDVASEDGTAGLKRAPAPRISLTAT